MAELIHHSKLDKKRWDNLVDQTHASTIFSKSFYWDATADDWYVYLDKDYRFGIPIGCTKKLSFSLVYPPFFHRYTEIIGDASLVDQKHFWNTLQNTFQRGTFQTKTKLLPITPTIYHHQTLRPSSFQPKDQAKRMLKKAAKKSYTVKEGALPNETIKFITKTLAKRMSLYGSQSVERLHSLVNAASQAKNIHVFELYEGESLVGGLIGLNDGKTMLYLKGACTDTATDFGGMYLLMKTLIEKAESLQLDVDFGGSRIEGVRFFNTRFNGQDEAYYSYTWDYTPIWYKILRNFKQRIKKQ